MRRFFTAGAVGLLALGLLGCSASTPTASGAATGSGASSDPTGSITVYAAASLTDVFTQIGDRFEAANPGAQVDFSFAGSSDLVSQLVEGAPADVFASADEKNMQKAVDGGVIDGDPQLFATNTLEIVVAAGNPAGITSLSDLARSDVKVVVCAAQVPCGAATAKATEAAGVTLSPVSEESSVTDVLAKVTSGQADAGVVYVTDIARAGSSVEGIPFDQASTAVNRYPIATVKDAKNPALAAAFTSYVTGEEGRAALAAAGFGAP